MCGLPKDHISAHTIEGRGVWMYNSMMFNMDEGRCIWLVKEGGYKVGRVAHAPTGSAT